MVLKWYKLFPVVQDEMQVWNLFVISKQDVSIRSLTCKEAILALQAEIASLIWGNSADTFHLSTSILHKDVNIPSHNIKQVGLYGLIRKFCSFFASGCLSVGHKARFAPSICNHLLKKSSEFPELQFMEGPY